MLRRWSVMVGILLLSSALVCAGPAQEILGEMAETSRGQRMASGAISIGLGAVVGMGGAILLADQGLGSYAMMAGGLIALPGILALVIPSQAEQACARACHSEAAAADALEEMAWTARIARYVSGSINAVAGTLSLLFPYRYLTSYDYVYSAIASYGQAASDLLIPSREERAYQRYLDLVAAGG